MINIESSAVVVEDTVEAVAELVTLDDTKLRQVGGGVVVVMNF
jgi:uncharacterized protein YjeT (DUF2065 family)